jgi:hypothetical protein
MICSDSAAARSVTMGALLLVAVTLLASLTGCATAERMKKLSPGMSREQVVKIMGRPTGAQVKGSYEQLQYAHRLLHGWSNDRADLSVVLKDGRVVAYGHGEVRDRSPRMIYHAGFVNQNITGDLDVSGDIRHSGTINVRQYGF